MVVLECIYAYYTLIKHESNTNDIGFHTNAKKRDSSKGHMLQELLNLGLVEIGADDSRFQKMQNAANALSRHFVEKPELLVTATLIALDDDSDEGDPFFELVEKLVIVEWVTLRNTHVNRPRQLLRSITVDAIEWSDIDGKPASLADGLSPGEYSIRVFGKAGTNFVIEDKETLDWVMEPINLFSELVGKDSPSQLVYSVEVLLSHLNDEGRSAPYYCDALDLLERSDMKSEFARSRRQLVLKSLGKNTEQQADPSQTGIVEIDSLREMIRVGSWTKAKEEATKLAQSNDRRTAGLAKLYLAVIAGESSIASVYVDDPAAE